MRNIFFLCTAALVFLTFQLPILPGHNAYAQTSITWELLTDVEAIGEYDALGDTTYYRPVFGGNVRAYNNKTVTITGYVLPLSIDGSLVVVSRLPYASCFFCAKPGGKGAGPESVVLLKLKKRYDWLKLDDVVKFKGKLVLNETDPDPLFYILRDAEPSSAW